MIEFMDMHRFLKPIQSDRILSNLPLFSCYKQLHFFCNPRYHSKNCYYICISKAVLYSTSSRNEWKMSQHMKTEYMLKQMLMKSLLNVISACAFRHIYIYTCQTNIWYIFDKIIAPMAFGYCTSYISMH